MEDSLEKNFKWYGLLIWLGRPYHFNFIKNGLPQLLLGPFLNTLTHMKVSVIEACNELYFGSAYKLVMPKSDYCSNHWNCWLYKLFILPKYFQRFWTNTTKWQLTQIKRVIYTRLLLKYTASPIFVFKVLDQPSDSVKRLFYAKYCNSKIIMKAKFLTLVQNMFYRNTESLCT